MQASPRAMHSKSRGGCLRCKAKKVSPVRTPGALGLCPLTPPPVVRPNATRGNPRAPGARSAGSSARGTRSTSGGRGSTRSAPTGPPPPRRRAKTRRGSSAAAAAVQVPSGTHAPMRAPPPPRCTSFRPTARSSTLGSASPVSGTFPCRQHCLISMSSLAPCQHPPLPPGRRPLSVRHGRLKAPAPLPRPMPKNRPRVTVYQHGTTRTRVQQARQKTPSKAITI